MKNRLLIFLTFLFISSSIFGQTYYPMPLDSASWTYTSYGFGTNPPETKTYHYGFRGDTLIDGLKYSKLYNNPAGQAAFPDELCFNVQTAPYLTYMREDMDKKVWFKIHPDSTEKLIYDFGLNVGETFCFPTLQPATGTFCFEVSKVDSILINGEFRRQIHFEDTNGEEQWIEGIGSKTELYFASWTLIGNVDSELDCYYEKGKLIFGDSTICNCDIDTNVEDIFSLDYPLKIFPNPFDNQFIVELELKEKEKVQLQIMNGLGQIIETYEYTLSQGEHQLNIETSWSSGIYFIQLVSEKGRVSKKIIKN